MAYAGHASTSASTHSNGFMARSSNLLMRQRERWAKHVRSLCCVFAQFSRHSSFTLSSPDSKYGCKAGSVPQTPALARCQRARAGAVEPGGVTRLHGWISPSFHREAH